MANGVFQEAERYDGHREIFAEIRQRLHALPDRLIVSDFLRSIHAARMRWPAKESLNQFVFGRIVRYILVAFLRKLGFDAEITDRLAIKINGKPFQVKSSCNADKSGYIHLLNKRRDSAQWRIPTLVLTPEGMYYLDPEKDGTRVVTQGNADKLPKRLLAEIPQEYIVPFEGIGAPEEGTKHHPPQDIALKEAREILSDTSLKGLI